ncbi:MAG: tetratricopeptide repeat protein, partial [Candidatus Caldatribacteriaceae bacterium]
DDAWDFQEHFETFYDGQPGIGDVVQWLALLRKGDAIYIAQPLSFFRQHSEQAQRNPQKIFYLVRSWYYLITRSRTLGYLQEPLLYREALIHLVQTLERWLQVFPFVEQQRELLRHLITKAQNELQNFMTIQGQPPYFRLHPILRTTKIKERSTPSAEKQYQTIQHMIQKGLHDAAIEALEAFTLNFPDSAVAFNDLGVLYFLHGDIDRAMKNFQTCLKKDPQQMDALENLRFIREMDKNREATS